MMDLGMTSLPSRKSGGPPVGPLSLPAVAGPRSLDRSILVGADDLAAGAGAQAIPRRQVDRVLDEPDRPVGHRSVGAAGVIAPERQVGPREVIYSGGAVGRRAAIGP